MIMMISAQKSEDLLQQGMGPEHLDQFVSRIATSFICEQPHRTIGYCGHLHQNGKGDSQILDDSLAFRILAEKRTPVVNYLPEPLLSELTPRRCANRLGVVRSVPAHTQGTALRDLHSAAAQALSFCRLQKQVWTSELRDVDDSNVETPRALLILGGELKAGPGLLPRVADELFFALQATPRPAIFLLGGFGGAVARLCESLTNKAPLSSEFRRDAHSEHLELVEKELADLQKEGLLEAAEAEEFSPKTHYERFEKSFEELQKGWPDSLGNGLNENLNRKLMTSVDFIEVSTFLEAYDRGNSDAG